MKSSFTKQLGSIIDLKVELTLEEFKKYWEPALEDAINNVNLKGFRPGQAPREMARQYVNEEKVFEKAAHEAVRFSLNEVIEDNGWTVIDKPQVTINHEDQGFSYEAKLTLFPEIEPGDYKKIAHKHKPAMAVEVSEKEVDDALEWLRKSRNAPELNDSFAQSVGPTFKNLADLRQNTKEGILMEKRLQEKEKSRLKILEELINQSKVEIPQVMIDKTRAQIEKERPGAKAGDLEAAAKKRIKMQLITYKIAQLEELHPTKEEVEEELAKLPKQEKIDISKFYDYIYDVLQNKKVFEFLDKQ